MASISANLTVLVILLIATSCVMVTKKVESIRVDNVVEKQVGDDKGADESGGGCWDVTSSETKACSPGCSFVPTTEKEGVCMPAHVFSDTPTECQIHSDCSKLDPDSYCVKLIDAPYGMCSRSIKF